MHVPNRTNSLFVKGEQQQRRNQTIVLPDPRTALY